MPSVSELWLIRHAQAPSGDEFKGPDADRPLSTDGVDKFESFCEWLADETTIPYTIVSSPFLRARQTAEILAAAAGVPKTAVINADELKPGTDGTVLIRYLREQTVERLAMVFHEPELSNFLNTLIGGGQFEWAKGGIIRVDFPEGEAPDAGNGAIRWYVRRKLG